MEKKAKLILFYLIAILSFYVFVLQVEGKIEEIEPSKIFVEASNAYKSANYIKAAKLFEKLLQMGICNGHIYYNLGNAYFKAGEIGKAILNYRRAELFIPRDEDLSANLQYTLQLTKDKIEGKEALSFVRNFCFWYSKLNLKELILVFLISNFLLWVICCLRLFLKKEFLSFTLYIFIFFTLLFGVSSVIKLYSFYHIHNGVVIGEEINVRAGKSVNDTVLFKLHEGTEFRWEKEEDGWVKIKLKDGKKGWVQRFSVEKII